LSTEVRGLAAGAPAEVAFTGGNRPQILGVNDSYQLSSYMIQCIIQ
jgi:hypothetical protein